MTFRPERYPANWPEIRARILARAGNTCECAGECGDTHPGDNGRCDAPNGEHIFRDLDTPARWYLYADSMTDMARVKVVLTVAHLDHDESNNRDSNIAALCQRCHLRHDAADNARRRRANRDRARGQGMLPGLGGTR